MITSDTKIFSQDEDSTQRLNIWTQLAAIMLKVGIIKDIFNSLGNGVTEFEVGQRGVAQRLDISTWKMVDRWREIQMQKNSSVEKLNRGQFYIGVSQIGSTFGYDSSDKWGVFYVNPLSEEGWVLNSDVGLIYFGANTMALIFKDEEKNEGKEITERTSLLNEINVEDLSSWDMGYNSTLADVTILNEPEDGGYNPWSMGYDQSWFEREGWKFYPITFEVSEETPPQLGVFNWWW